MSLKTWVAGLLAARRVRQVARQAREPERLQRELLQSLLRHAGRTEWGTRYRFVQLHSYEAFRDAVPVNSYETLRPAIEAIYRHGTRDVLWPGLPLYFAKTSGTTSGAKYIPISRESMPNHVKGAKDALLFYIHETRNARFLDGKMIFLQGSPVLEASPSGIPTGRLSGIAAHYVPPYLQTNRVPSFATNCIEDWETKIDRIVEETRTQDLRLVSGIPPWVLMYFERLHERTGKKPIEVWPNLQLFVQGGVDYTPYRPLLDSALGKAIDMVEVFPASEGFFAVQSSQQEPGLQLMLDYGVFFEFIPVEDYGQPHARRIPLWEVELERQYALIVTTNAGLWAYDIGDTVKFVSRQPYRLVVTGRVKHFISAFGEHVIAEEVNRALTRATQQAGGVVTEFSVAPWVGEESCHEWFIEFEVLPDSLDEFARNLDTAMQDQNIYYKDLRAGSILAPARIVQIQRDGFRNYMKSIGKLGGQNKLPRLTNDRALANGLAPWVQPSTR
jgi:hypothetical protein